MSRKIEARALIAVGVGLPVLLIGGILWHFGTTPTPRGVEIAVVLALTIFVCIASGWALERADRLSDPWWWEDR